MDEIAFEQKLNELANEIESMPEPHRAKFIALVRQTGNCHRRLRKSVNSLQESLDYLRICIKYQLFDLEATRRENQYLRHLLDHKNK